MKTKKQTVKQTIEQSRLIIFDVDNTLVTPSRGDFYGQYKVAVNHAVAKYLEIDIAEATKIAEYYREHFGGGEQVLFLENVHEHFPKFNRKPKDYTILYEFLSEINPEGFFEPNNHILNFVKNLRKDKKIIVAVTDSPDTVSQKILELSDFEIQTDFDRYIAYTKKNGPPKHIKKQKVFEDILKCYNLLPNEALSIGDSYKYDILPAQEVGIKTVLLSQKKYDNYAGLQFVNLLEVIDSLKLN